MGIYLVDYENVHNDGVQTSKNSLHLTVLSFFTETASSPSLLKHMSK